MCGSDGIGARIAEQLTRAGESMVVQSESAGPAHAAILQGQTTTMVDPVVGVAQTLDVAGIDRAKAVICVTGDDLKNLEFVLLARASDAPTVGSSPSWATWPSVGRCGTAVAPERSWTSRRWLPPRSWRPA